MNKKDLIAKAKLWIKLNPTLVDRVCYRPNYAFICSKICVFVDICAAKRPLLFDSKKYRNKYNYRFDKRQEADSICWKFLDAQDIKKDLEKWEKKNVRKII